MNNYTCKSPGLEPFDSPPPGLTAAQNLAEENSGLYSAFIPSVEAAYRVGSKVLHEITGHWDKYEKTVPTAPPGQ